MAAKAATSVYLTGAVVQVENTAAEVEALISSHGNTPNALVELTQEYEKEKQGVLKVPNAALRFKWQPSGAASDRSGTGTTGAGGPPAARAANGAKAPGVWVLDGQKPRRAPLTLGISDGSETAVLEGELKEGDAVIIEATGQAKKGATPTGGPRLF